MTVNPTFAGYRGRLAPSPTGHLHLGHARTFQIALDRARNAGGALVLRIEDLDTARVRPEFVEGIHEDLRWAGFEWQEGPDVGGPCSPYTQSERMPLYREAFDTLRRAGVLYPCFCSRKDVLRALAAPHQGEDEPVYPGTCRPDSDTRTRSAGFSRQPGNPVSWRFRVPDGETIRFVDGHFGLREMVAGVDFGDFVVWRQDDLPSYQLSVVVDDALMQITEVVRGADLLRSTARQILLYRALNWHVPTFHHCPLVTDAAGNRLAKRHASLSLRALREKGYSPDQIRSLQPS